MFSLWTYLCLNRCPFMTLNPKPIPNVGTNQLLSSPAKTIESRLKCYRQLSELRNLVESGLLSNEECQIAIMDTLKKLTCWQVNTYVYKQLISMYKLSCTHLHITTMWNVSMTIFLVIIPNTTAIIIINDRGDEKTSKAFMNRWILLDWKPPQQASNQVSREGGSIV